MIPKQEQVQVFSNSSNEKSFTINASASAFAILSSGLYSNKIQAIIRELSCNAYDAHVMAGTPDRPFNIHLPDRWEPFFSIEDFGIGLDDEDVDNIYTSYFTSTKTKSNDVIGGLGLGSKTPFSYTDTFTVRTRKDGVERVYSAFIKDGGPTISMMSEEDTDEPNGVLVTVPVRQEDFCNFQSEAKKVFQWFRVLPNINIVTLDNANVKKLDDARGLLIDSNFIAGTVIAVMGNVAYSVAANTTLIPEESKTAWLFLKNSSLTVRFDIGDLSPAANRETISFDDETKETFNKKINSVVEDYYDSIQKEIDDTCKTKLEALAFAEKELGRFSWNILTFEGETLNDIAEFNVVDTFEDMIKDGDLTVWYEYKQTPRGMGKLIIDDENYVSKWSYKSAANCHIAVIMDDSGHGRGLDRSARQFARENNVDKVYTSDKVLTAEAQEKLIEVFGEKVTFHNFTDVRESQKIVREKEAVVRGPRKTPVARAKKNEIRIDIWENNADFGDKEDIKKAKRMENIPNKLVDIDQISDKRVGLFLTNRGCSEFQINGQIMPLSIEAMISLTKLYGLDYIVVSRISEYERIKEKMPFLIDLHDLTKKDIKDNDFYFLAHMLQMGMGNALFEDDEQIRVKLYSRSSFANKYDIDKKRKALYLDKLDLGVLKSNFNTGFDNLVNKFNSVYESTFTEVEQRFIGACLHMEQDIEHFIDDEINKEAEKFIGHRQEIMDRFPLLENLVASYMNDDLKEKLETYVRDMIDLENLRKDLYQQVA